VIVLWVLLGLVGFILLLLCLPVYVVASYKEKLELSVRVLFVGVPLVPKKEKKPQPEWVEGVKNTAAKAGKGIKRAAKNTAAFLEDKLGISLKKKKKEKKPQTAEKAEEKQEKKGALGAMLEDRGFSGLAELIMTVAGLAYKRAGGILRGVTIDRLELDINIGGEDAAQTAVSYGRWCALLFPAITVILGAVRRCRFRNVRISPDFCSEESHGEMYVRLHAYPLLVAHHALRFVLSLLWSEIKRNIEESKPEAQPQ